jgi:hypothetical protein
MYCRGPYLVLFQSWRDGERCEVKELLRSIWKGLNNNQRCLSDSQEANKVLQVLELKQFYSSFEIFFRAVRPSSGTAVMK